jgi:signal transduction histidine kinase
MKTKAGNKQNKHQKKRSLPHLKFRILPAYAEFLLEHRLRDFIGKQLHLMMDLDFHLLKRDEIAAFTEEEIIEHSIPAHELFLKNAASNSLADHLADTLERWKADQLPTIRREQLLAEDITMSVYIRKRALMEFIPGYTRDVDQALALVNEIEEYSLEAETRSFATFIEIQNQHVKKINRQLERSSSQLLEAQQLSSIGSFEWDLAGKGRSSFTPELKKILAISDLKDPLVVLQHVHPQDRERVKQLLDGILKGRTEFEIECRYRAASKNKLLWVRGIVEQRDAKPFRIRGTVMDITARQRMLMQLQKNEELYKQAERLANLGNWTYDPRNGAVTWSDQLYRIFDLSPQSREIDTAFFLTMVHSDERARVKVQMRRILSGEQSDYTLRIVLPGQKLRHLRGKAEVLKDEIGRTNKIIGTCQDITREVLLTEELKQREEHLAQLNTSLEQKNVELQRKNEELTSFNYIASHDLQEPLRKIKTFCDLTLTREGPSLSDAGKQWLQRISAAAGRLQKLIQDLLAFSRTQLFDDSRRPVDLNEVLAGIKSSYENEIAQGTIQIQTCALPVIKCVPFQIQQLFENIISNSVKYKKEDSPCIVKIMCTSAEVIGTLPQAEHEYIRISFSDNGIGFEQKYASKIFEIFQRLHGQLSYSGTGIGLAICKKIAENHNGMIRASGAPGQGSVFDVYLPASIVVESRDCLRS